MASDDAAFEQRYHIPCRTLFLLQHFPISVLFQSLCFSDKERATVMLSVYRAHKPEFNLFNRRAHTRCDIAFHQVKNIAREHCTVTDTLDVVARLSDHVILRGGRQQEQQQRQQQQAKKLESHRRIELLTWLEPNSGDQRVGVAQKRRESCLCFRCGDVCSALWTLHMTLPARGGQHPPFSQFISSPHLVVVS